MAAKPDGDGPVLRVENLSKSFGGVRAVRNVSLEVAARSIHSIIGPNGAGKTSLINMVSGFYQPDTGVVRFNGVDITKLRPSQRARRGIARTFQNIALFRGMTVLDNIMLGRHVHMRIGLLRSFL